MRLEYQEYLCTCLNLLLIHNNPLYDDIKELFNYIIHSFQQRQIYNEGITLIGQFHHFLEIYLFLN